MIQCLKVGSSILLSYVDSDPLRSEYHSPWYVYQCSLAYHHFPDIRDTTHILTFFLRPGGSLIVADITKDDLGTEFLDKHRDIVAHPAGFSEEDMREAFSDAGLVDFEFSVAARAKTHGHEVNIFLARGVKAHASREVDIQSMQRTD